MTPSRNRVTLVDVPTKLNRSREVRVRGERIQGTLSPFDFPEKLGVGLRDGWAFLEFIYPVVPSEELELRQDNDLRIQVGRRSGRVFLIEFRVGISGTGRIEIPLEPVFAEAMKVLERAARELPANQRPPRRIAHYAMVEEMLPNLAPAIEAGLARLRAEQVAGR